MSNSMLRKIEDNPITAYVIIMLVVALGFLLFDYYTCKGKWTSFHNNYKIFGGCQIKVDNKWIPAGSYYFKEE